MGSCPTKRKTSLDQREETCKEAEETTLERKVSEMVESTEPEPNSTNEDKQTAVPCYAADEQHTVPKVQQSFSWLASTPVGSGSPANQQKEKPRKPMEDREQARNVVKYRNEKYLKSWQHSEEWLKTTDRRYQVTFVFKRWQCWWSEREGVEEENSTPTTSLSLEKWYASTTQGSAWWPLLMRKPSPWRTNLPKNIYDIMRKSISKWT